MIEKTSPLVSICIPCYNQENYIGDCLNSILNLTYPNIEVIISDDYSSDSTCEIVRGFIDKLNRKAVNVLFIENKKNLGITKNCNQMYRAATGRYIKIIAGDDMLLPSAIDILVEYMEGNDALVVLGNVCRVENSYNYGEVFDNTKLIDAKQLNSIEYMHDELLQRNIVNCVGMMLDRRIFELVGYYDENLLFEDWDYWLRVTEKYKLLFIEEVCCLYRASDTSVSNYIGTKDKQLRLKKFGFMYEGALQVYDKHLNKIEIKKKNDILKEFVMNYWFQAILFDCEGYIPQIRKTIEERKIAIPKIEILEIQIKGVLARIWRAINGRKFKN